MASTEEVKNIYAKKPKKGKAPTQGAADDQAEAISMPRKKGKY